MASLRFVIVFCFVLTAATSSAYAHKLQIDCRIKDERIRVEAFYDDDTPAQQAKITIENLDKKIVVEGKTDDRGVWSNPLLPPGRYVVRAQSVGHADKANLIIPESAQIQKTTSQLDPIAPVGDALAPMDESGQTRWVPREEATGVLWTKVAIGFVVIAALFAIVRLARRGSTNNNISPD